MCTWTRLVPAILLVLPVSGSSFAADTDTNSKAIEQLQKDIKQLRDDMQKFQDAAKQNDLRGAAIQEQLNEVLRRLDRLAQQQQALERTAFYQPPTVPGGALPGAVVPATTATVHLVNRYPSPAQVRINGQTYTVGGFQTIQVPRVPSGLFEYSVEVDGQMIIAPHTETLPPKGYRITIYQP